MRPEAGSAAGSMACLADSAATPHPLPVHPAHAGQRAYHAVWLGRRGENTGASTINSLAAKELLKMPAHSESQSRRNNLVAGVPACMPRQPNRCHALCRHGDGGMPTFQSPVEEAETDKPREQHQNRQLGHVLLRVLTARGPCKTRAGNRRKPHGIPDPKPVRRGSARG